MIRSVHIQLTLWYVGVLALILCLFGWVLYHKVATNLAQDIDNILASQADGVVEAIFAFREVQEEEESPADQEESASPWSVQRTIDEMRFPILVARWADKTGSLQGIHPIRIFDYHGKLLAASKSFEEVPLLLTEPAVAGALQGHTDYETLSFPNYRIRVMTYPVIEDNRLLYIVQAAAILREMDASLKELRLWLTWLIPFTLLVASSVGWFLATTALKPVGRMTRQAQKISAGHLNIRIDVPRTNDELERLAVTFNDMLERLESAFRRLLQFSAAASHELRTPLTAMRGELEVALRKPRQAQEYQEVLRFQLEALKEMTHIVEQLLTLARSEKETSSIEWQPVELGELAKQTSHALRTLAEAKAVQLNLTVREPLWIRGESHLLERLISNLLDNAIKHTPGRGQVSLRVWRQDHEACLRVEDTGPGIPSEEQAKIFDQFFTRTPSLDLSRFAIGLGLCRWIAEAHQGRITVKSVPGQGATFTVHFPLSES